MLWFPEHFFESEYREDFLVDVTMKTVWAAELEVLAEIAAICTKYQLRWFADWGTLLGAVRHNGFVPWDDDMDICLLRDDYDRLMKVLPNELPKGYIVHHASVNSQDQFWACVQNSDVISVEEEHLKKFHGCPFVVGIDVFPLDYLPRDEEARKLEENLFILIWKLVKLQKNKERTEEEEMELLDGLEAIEGYFKTKIDRNGDIVTCLWELANDLCRVFTADDSDELVMFLSYVKNSVKRYQPIWFDDTEYLPFESVEMAVPKNYHEVLSVEYGDYSIRKRDEASHDYPYYKKQIEQLQNEIKRLEEKQNN